MWGGIVLSMRGAMWRVNNATAGQTREGFLSLMSLMIISSSSWSQCSLAGCGWSMEALGHRHFVSAWLVASQTETVLFRELNFHGGLFTECDSVHIRILRREMNLRETELSNKENSGS